MTSHQREAERQPLDAAAMLRCCDAAMLRCCPRDMLIVDCMYRVAVGIAAMSCRRPCSEPSLCLYSRSQRGCYATMVYGSCIPPESFEGSCTIPHTIPYHTMPYHTIPYHTMPRHVSSSHRPMYASTSLTALCMPWYTFLVTFSVPFITSFPSRHRLTSHITIHITSSLSVLPY